MPYCRCFHRLPAMRIPLFPIAFRQQCSSWLSSRACLRPFSCMVPAKRCLSASKSMVCLEKATETIETSGLSPERHSPRVAFCQAARCACASVQRAQLVCCLHVHTQTVPNASCIHGIAPNLQLPGYALPKLLPASMACPSKAQRRSASLERELS